MEAILDKVSEYDIFRHYFGDFEIGKPFNSPFRKDNNPSFQVNQLRNGRLMFVDYGQEDYDGGVTDMLRLWYPGRKYPELLEMLDKDMGLGFTTGIQTYSKAKTVINHIAKKDSIIQITPRKNFTDSELAYWRDYTLSESEIRGDNIFPVKKLYLDGMEKKLDRNELLFAILFSNRYWKLYRPYADKKRKWLSNVPFDLMYGLDSFNSKPRKAIITKAYKDWMIIKKYFPYVAGIQGESSAAISMENQKFIFEHVQEPWINCDPDKAGRKAAQNYIERGFKDLCMPDTYYLEHGIKDYAQLVKDLGPQALIDNLKLNGFSHEF